MRISLNEPKLRQHSLIIDSIKYNNDCQLYLNDQLNVIIGGRSTGESTLIKAINNNQNNIIPISKTKYNDYSLDIVYENVKILWKDDGKEHNDRNIVYIPQDYMINLANDSKQLSELIKKILSINNDPKVLQNIEELLNKNQEVLNSLNKLLIEYKNLNKQINELHNPSINIEEITKDIEKIEDLLKALTQNIILKKQYHY